MKSFVAISSVEVVPGLTLEEGTRLTPRDGKYFVPGTLVEVSPTLLNSMKDVFAEVKRFDIHDVESFNKVLSANVDKEIDDGGEMLLINLDGEEGETVTFDATNREHIALLASGFAVPLPANAKQLKNRILNLNKVYGLGIDKNAINVRYAEDKTGAIKEILMELVDNI